MVIGTCKICKKQFSHYPSSKRKYCSQQCYSRVKVKNLGLRFFGRKHTPETREKIKKGQSRGSEHPLWKGEKIHYTTLHQWVYRNKGKPKKCEHCGTTSENKRYDWANKSGKYKRDLNDFIRVCQSCHCRFFDKKSNVNKRSDKRKQGASS